MGRFKDLTGEKFEHLTVVERVDDFINVAGKPFIQYDCICDCGNHVKVTAHNLRRGHKKSCSNCGAYNRFKDLSELVFDDLSVLRHVDDYLYPDGSKDAIWACKCVCGRIVNVRGNVLKDKNYKHACPECYRHRSRKSDIVGKIFGKLTVISDLGNDEYSCVCECGNTVKVNGKSLRNGHTSSCGCYRLDLLSGTNYMSKSEAEVNEYLTQNNFSFTRQKYFNDLKGLSGNLLSYDFCINLNNNLFLIECQGLQHYEPVEFFGGKRSFGCQKVHDFRKRDYASRHGYELLEIDCSKGVPKNLHLLLDDFLYTESVITS